MEVAGHREDELKNSNDHTLLEGKMTALSYKFSLSPDKDALQNGKDPFPHYGMPHFKHRSGAARIEFVMVTVHHEQNVVRGYVEDVVSRSPVRN
jgi:hypothetical protein